MLISRQALASGIIVPLYLFPGDPPSCSAWSSLFSTLSLHPDVPFYLIVNPDSGPGSPNTQPSTNYQGCIPKLNATNTIVVGYVPTGFGTDSVSTVEAGINTYAGWASAYRPSGIFFDEVSGTSGDLSKYEGYANLAKSSFGDGHGTVILNPGAMPADTGYFSIADLIITAENFFSDFSASELTISISAPAAKQAVILHDGPSSPPTALINQLVATDHIAALYITDDTMSTGDDNPYDSLPSDFEAFVSGVKAAEATPIIVSG